MWIAVVSISEITLNSCILNYWQIKHNSAENSPNVVGKVLALYCQYLNNAQHTFIKIC